MKVLETERLTVRELSAATDAGFICALLNSPKFLKYIGDRGVRSPEAAAEFIETRYRQSYRDHGFGLYKPKQFARDFIDRERFHTTVLNRYPLGQNRHSVIQLVVDMDVHAIEFTLRKRKSQR